jgi:hypothetical protein
MHSEKDRPFTFTQLLDSLLKGVRAKVTRTEYITWLAPSESGNWSLFLFVACVIEPWAEPIIISEILEARPFRVAIDNKKRQQITVVLVWQPDPPPSSPPPEESATTAPAKKQAKGAIKKEPKRPISAGSAKRDTSAKRLPIKRPNVRTRAALFKKEQEPVKEEPVDENATDDADDDADELPGLEELLRSAGRRM